MFEVADREITAGDEEVVEVNERATKTIWHLLLTGAAVYETCTARTNLRKLLAGACAGWHATAAVMDFLDTDNETPFISQLKK